LKVIFNKTIKEKKMTSYLIDKLEELKENEKVLQGTTACSYGRNRFRDRKEA
jgi:hypothetical protein